MPLFPSPPSIPTPPPAAAPATMANANAVTSGANARAKAAGAMGAAGTNPTGSEGLVAPPSTAGKKLLGE